MCVDAIISYRKTSKKLPWYTSTNLSRKLVAIRCGFYTNLTHSFESIINDLSLKPATSGQSSQLVGLVKISQSTIIWPTINSVWEKLTHPVPGIWTCVGFPIIDNQHSTNGTHVRSIVRPVCNVWERVSQIQPAPPLFQMSTVVWN